MIWFSHFSTDSEASTILGMQTIWFVIGLVFLILSVAGLVTAAVLCFCRQRAATPRHPHNAHNAQTHPPVSFPCEFRKNRAQPPSRCVCSSILSFFPNQWTMKFSAPFHVFHAKSRPDPPIAFSCYSRFCFFFLFVSFFGFGRDSFVRSFVIRKVFSN